MDDTQLLVQLLQENASALGIKWQLRPATILSVTADSTVVNLRIDGDSDNGSVHATTLIGPLAPGVRVMCLIIPHEIIFVIGTFNSVARYQIGETVEYTATDTFNDTDFPGMRAAKMMGIGGGGGGGFAGAAAAGNAAAGGGGAGGSYAEVLVTVATLGGLDWTVTIPSGGAGGTSAAIDGATGSDMTIINGSTTLLSAPGGGGGESVSASTGAVVAQGGNPGSGGTGDFIVPGSPGMNGYHGASFAVAGSGGPAGMWGVVTRGNGTDNGGTPTAAAANTGSGGAGAHSNPGGAAFNGGAGSSGRGRITILY